MNKLHDLSSGSLARPSHAEAPSANTAELIPPELRAAGAMAPDPLSDVLNTLRLKGAVFFLWNVSWPYATPVPAGRAIAPTILPGAQAIVSYHIVTRGTCWGSLIGGPPVPLAAGDILLIPHGDPYVIASSTQLCAEAKVQLAPALGFFRRMAAGELPFVVAEGGGGEVSTHLVCGFLGCDLRPFNPALAALPALVHLRPPTAPSQERLQSLIEYNRRNGGGKQASFHGDPGNR